MKEIEELRGAIVTLTALVTALVESTLIRLLYVTSSSI